MASRRDGRGTGAGKRNPRFVLVRRMEHHEANHDDTDGDDVDGGEVPILVFENEENGETTSAIRYDGKGDDEEEEENIVDPNDSDDVDGGEIPVFEDGEGEVVDLLANTDDFTDDTEEDKGDEEGDDTPDAVAQTAPVKEGGFLP